MHYEAKGLSSHQVACMITTYPKRVANLSNMLFPRRLKVAPPQSYFGRQKVRYKRMLVARPVLLLYHYKHFLLCFEGYVTTRY